MDDAIRRIVILDPFRGNWVRLLFMCVLYTVTILPVDMAFDLPFMPWTIFDCLVILVFALDIVVNFYAAYKNDEDEWVTDPIQIKRHYLRGWFLFDVIAALPVDFIVDALSTDKHMAAQVQAIRILKTIRLIRAVKLLDNIHIKGLPAWMQLWCLVLAFFLLARAPFLSFSL